MNKLHIQSHHYRGIIKDLIIRGRGMKSNSFGIKAINTGTEGEIHTEKLHRKFRQYHSIITDFKILTSDFKMLTF